MCYMDTIESQSANAADRLADPQPLPGSQLAYASPHATHTHSKIIILPRNAPMQDSVEANRYRPPSAPQKKQHTDSAVLQTY